MAFTSPWGWTLLPSQEISPVCNVLEKLVHGRGIPWSGVLTLEGQGSIGESGESYQTHSIKMHSWDHSLLSLGWLFLHPKAHPGTTQVSPSSRVNVPCRVGILRPAPTSLMDPGALCGGGCRAQALPDPPLLRGLRHLRPGLRPHHRCLPLLQVGAGKENLHSRPPGQDPTTMGRPGGWPD